MKMIRKILLLIFSAAFLYIGLALLQLWQTTRHTTNYPRSTTCIVSPSTIPDPQHISPSIPDAQQKIILLHWMDSQMAVDEWWMNSQCGCPHLKENCLFTCDKNLSNTADAIVFNIRQLGWNFSQIPQQRFPWQRYVMFMLESPSYSYHIDLRNGRNLFNWTMTYRTDSNIWYPYTGYRACEKINPEMVYDEKKLVHIVHHKTKLVAWFVSNCYTMSGRELYVKELQKHIQVDIFGACGPLNCSQSISFETRTSWNEEKKCRNMLQKEYKFYLAFENSVCDDYITEKFYRRIQDFLVPIVLRGKDYRKINPVGHPRAPERSFIAVDDFRSVEALAQYLHYLDKNDTEYLSYFHWRQKWEMNYDYKLFGSPPFCTLCEMLNKNLPEKRFDDLHKWWFGENNNTCNNDVVKKLIDNFL